MTASGRPEPKGEALRRAVRWVVEQPSDCTRELLEEAASRFDLSPKDEEFLLAYFRTRLPHDT